MTIATPPTLADAVFNAPLRYLTEYEAPTPAPTCPPPGAKNITTVANWPRYESDIDKLPGPERAKIDQAAQTILNMPTPPESVCVVGHADRDPTRTPAFHQQVSEDRARAVAQELEQRLALHKPGLKLNVQTVGRGAAQLTKLGPAANRAEIFVLAAAPTFQRRIGVLKELRVVDVIAMAWLDGGESKVFRRGESHTTLNMPRNFKGRLNLQIVASWRDENGEADGARVLTTWDVFGGVDLTTMPLTYTTHPRGGLFLMSPGSSGQKPFTVSSPAITGPGGLAGSRGNRLACSTLVLRHRRGHPLVQQFSVHLNVEGETRWQPPAAPIPTDDPPDRGRASVVDPRIPRKAGLPSFLRHRAWAVIVYGDSAGQTVDFDLPATFPYVASGQLPLSPNLCEVEFHIKSTWEFRPGSRRATGSSHSVWVTQNSTTAAGLGPWRLERVEGEGEGLVADIADTAVPPVSPGGSVVITESLVPQSVDRMGVLTAYRFDMSTTGGP